MYNQPFFIPGYQIYNMPLNMATRAAASTRGAGLFSRLGLGNIFSGLRRVNWGGLINNTSRTLGIINQTIPLVRQVGPMVNNMRSMLKVASIFKDETDTPTTTKSTSTKTTNTTNQTSTTNKNFNNKEISPIKTNTDYNNPTFFVSSN